MQRAVVRVPHSEDASVGPWWEKVRKACLWQVAGSLDELTKVILNDLRCDKMVQKCWFRQMGGGLLDSSYHQAARICSAAAFLLAGKNASLEFVWNVVPKSPASQNTQLLLGSILTLMRRGRVGSLAPRLKSFISGYLSEIATKCANLLGWSYLHIQCRARSISPRPFLHFFTCQSRLTPMTIKKSEMLCLQQDESPGRIASEAHHHRMIHLVFVPEN